MNASQAVKIVFHVKQRRINDSFTNTELAEDLVEHVLDVDTPGESAKGRRGVAQFFGDQFLMRSRGCSFGQGAAQGGCRLLKQIAVARPRSV